ncbi:hypothetical protein Tco_1214569 [Tanacetum coccineum]
MVAWFLRLEDALSWLLIEGKRDAITVDINAIALFRQSIGSSPIGSRMHFDIVVDDELLHMVMNVVNESIFVDQVVKDFVDTEEDCTENDGCSSKMVCDDS